MTSKVIHKTVAAAFAFATQPVVFLTVLGPFLLADSWIIFSNGSGAEQYGQLVNENLCTDKLDVKSCSALFTQGVRDHQIQYYTLILAAFFFCYGVVRPYLEFLKSNSLSDLPKSFFHSSKATPISLVVYGLAVVFLLYVFLEGSLMTSDALEHYFRLEVYSDKKFTLPPLESPLTKMRLLLFALGVLSLVLKADLKPPPSQAA